MNGYLRQSTASQSRLIGPFLDDTDFKTAETGLTIANTDIKLRANGTTLSNKNSGGGTHQVNGFYSVTWDATDSANVGELFYSVVVAGALPIFGSYVVLEEAVYDALFAASALGYVDGATVNATKIGGTTQTGRDLGASVLLSPGTGTGQVSLSSGTVTVGTNNDKTGYALSAAAVQAIWDALTSALTTAGSIGKRIVDFLTGDIYGRLGAPAGASVSADLAAVKSDTAAILTDTAEIGIAGAGLTNINLPNQTMDITGNITGNLSGSVGSVTGSVGSVASYGTLVGDIATAVWGATTRTLSAFSTSLAVSVWDVLASAVAAANSIGLQIKTNLDAAVSTRSTYAGGPVDSVTNSVGSVVGLTASDVGAIKAKTDLLPAAPAAVGDIPTALQNADALLKRDLSVVTGEAARSPLNALRFLRNKWSVAGGTLTVTKEDDTTTAWTAATTTDAAADPVTAVDPT